MTEPMCEICHDHYRTDYPDVPLIGAETFKTAHCAWCHSRAAAAKTQTPDLSVPPAESEDK